MWVKCWQCVKLRCGLHNANDLHSITNAFLIMNVINMFLYKPLNDLHCWTGLIWGLCIVTGAGCVMHSICGGSYPAVPARIHRVGCACNYRLSICLLGCPLFPVSLWDGGGCAFPLLCHRLKAQWRESRERVLYGQGSYGEWGSMGHMWM